ncbi:MAG: hypothetical protein Kow0031_38340 [Anaerolineae bacterium]
MAKKHKKDKAKKKKDKKAAGVAQPAAKPALKLTPPAKPLVRAKSSVAPKIRLKPKAEGLAIREMTLEDLPAVYALGERIFTADWPTLYRTWDEYEIVELFAADGDFCLVADLRGQVVGFVLGTHIFKRRSAWSYGYLLWLGVAPEARGLGLGEQLVERLTEVFIAHGARMMLVDTGVKNEPAKSLFEKMGFTGETQHIYFFRNLTRHPDYRKRQAAKPGRGKTGGKTPSETRPKPAKNRKKPG